MSEFLAVSREDSPTAQRVDGGGAGGNQGIEYAKAVGYPRTKRIEERWGL